MFGSVKNWYIRFQREGKEHGVNIGTRDFIKLIVIKILANNTIEDYLEQKLFQKGSFSRYLLHMRSNRQSWRSIQRKYQPDMSKTLSIKLHCDYHLCRILYPGINIVDYFRFEFFNFSRVKRKTFITEGYLKKLDRSFNGGLDNNNEAIEILSDKQRFNQVFNDYVKRKWIVSSDLDKEKYNDFCKGLDEVIVKPLNGIQGIGIYKQKVSNLKERDELFDKISSSYVIVEEVLRQDITLAEINPTSINTIRVFTVKTNDGRIVIADAAFRVGRLGSHTDNFHSGGIAFAINRDNGLIISRGVDENANSYYLHPDSKITIIGFTIPNWEKIKAACIGAHQKIASLRFIGWDVVVLENGEIELIEGNTFPGITDLYQYPSLDGRKEFYDGILKKHK